MKILSFAYSRAQSPSSEDFEILDATGLSYPLGSESGQSEGLRREVMANEEAKILVDEAISALLGGRSVAFGCFLGFQRSVALAEETAERARAANLEVEVEHLGLDQDKYQNTTENSS